MKKQLTVALGLAVLATPAFASKARLLALGESENGSFFINDNRNIFLNAAEANNHADMVTFEWGESNQTDEDTAPNAEGGILYSYKNLVYGLHLGRTMNFQDNASSEDMYSPSNTIDLFVAGDAGFKWGANLTYSQSNNDTHEVAGNAGKAEGQAMDLNVGAIFGNASVYVKGGLMGKAEQREAGTKVKFDRDQEIEIGGSYKLNNYTLFAQAGMEEYTTKGRADKETIENTFYTIGAARTERLSDKTMMFVKLSATMLDQEFKAGTKETTDVTFIPVAIGFEHDATSWLTLRGSVSQNLWSNVEEKETGSKKVESTIANSTSVNAGATLKLGDFMVDGLIGTGNNGAGQITNLEEERGVLSLDNLMTRVSLTYRF